MKLMKLKELNSRDVFEFSYGSNYNEEIFAEHWNENSLFMSDEDFSKLSKYINKVIEDFNYMGPNKIDLEKWFEMKNIVINSNKSELFDFINTIDDWLNLDPYKTNYFWILGV